MCDWKGLLSMFQVTQYRTGIPQRTQRTKALQILIKYQHYRDSRLKNEDLKEDISLHNLSFEQPYFFPYSILFLHWSRWINWIHQRPTFRGGETIERSSHSEAIGNIHSKDMMKDIGQSGGGARGGDRQKKKRKKKWALYKWRMKSFRS